jgi:hypothetical protein
MTGTGRKQTFWDAQSIIKCPVCGKPYKARSPFFAHLQYFHKLGYDGAKKQAKAMGFRFTLVCVDLTSQKENP